MSARVIKAGRGMARVTSSEWVWGGLGIGAAAASASFASYMLIFGPGPFGLQGSPDFGIFAHMAPRRAPAPAQATAALVRPDGAARGSPSANPRADAPGAVDFSPTGSVQSQAPRGRTGPALVKPAAVSPPLDGFVLRDVFDGKALVESRHALSLVAPGSVLEGAGAVLSIERRGDSWFVTTTGGVISGPR